MSYWPRLIVDGEILDLSHLEPFEFQCLPRDAANAATISVRFNDHCFTRTFDPATDSAFDILPEIFVGRHERRIFCQIRFALSLELPQFIKGLGDKRIASTHEGNLVRIETPGGNIYAIFFTLRRVNARRAELFVVSAYPVDKGRRPADTGEMKFDKALAKILRGEKARFPGR
ncbi:MAG: hypothetical protein WDN06_05875 [Asticcacaulis sp.]